MKYLLAVILICEITLAGGQHSLLNTDVSLGIPKLNFDAKGNLVMVASRTSSQNDFDFLIGKWKLKHRKLRARLVNSHDWDEFETIVEDFRILEGTGNMDVGHGIIDGKPWEGRTLRVFDPKTRLWSLHWLASNFGTIDPPVVGSFENGVGHFFCKDIFNGKNIIVMFRWDARNRDQSVWSQAFSPDNGKTWEWNWFNVKERFQEQPLQPLAVTNFAIPIPPLHFDSKGELMVTPSPASSFNDFDFLSGRWTLRHRKLTSPLTNSTEWEEFETEAESFKILGEAANMSVIHSVMDGNPWEVRTVRMYNPETRLWSLYSVASDVGVMEQPVVGTFENGVGHFFKREVFNGKKIIVMIRWNSTDKDNPVWSRAFSPDAGRTWEWNWLNVYRRLE